MADTKISDLTAVTDVLSTDEYVLARSGLSKKITGSDLADGIETFLGLAVGYGTSLPGSPSDGQEYVLVDSTTNPSYQWHFRYNSGSSSSYKWEFIGGAPAAAFVSTDQTTTTTGTWLNLTTTGPQVLIPRSGEYVCAASCSVYDSNAAIDLYLGIAANDGTPAVSTSLNVPAANYVANLVIAGRLLTFVASDNARVRYLTGAAGTAHWFNRMVTVIPMRVA